MPPVIDFDDHRFYRLVTLSNKLAAPVLRRVIKQYCDVHGLTFKDVLDIYKHELFHYWHGTRGRCCTCNNRRFNRVLLDKQWYNLFTDISASLPGTHTHSGHDAKGCPEVFSVRPGIDVDVCDISLASSILTNITGKITTTQVVGVITKTFITTGLNVSGLLEYTVDKLSHLSVNGFELFLWKHQHKLFHQMETQRCCQCTSDPDGRSVIRPTEWSTMYHSSPTPCTFPVCSHQYTPISGISRTSLTTHLLHRIDQAVGPVVTIRSVRNQIAHSVTATLDDPTFTVLWGELSGALGELIDIIADTAWQADMRSKIITLQTCPINGEMWEEYRRDLHKFLQVLIRQYLHF